MLLSPRALPWMLGFLGAVHGYSTARFDWDAELFQFPPALAGAAFGAALGFAGMLHLQRRTDRQGLLSAAAGVLLSCAALGIIPGLLFGLATLRLILPATMGALWVGLTALPSALLLIYAHRTRPPARKASLFSGADRAEDALAVLGAFLLLPWWRSYGRTDIALLLGLMALPAVAIAMQALILRSRAQWLASAFPHASVVASEHAPVVCDIGLGGGHRESASLVASYRRTAGATFAMTGDPTEGGRAALRLVAWAIALSSVVGLQAFWLLSHPARIAG